ncbi:hypothetical protein [Gordonia sp. ABSL49_1]|uniref:hypothetical protein n=1 Tax=Gordonia sp. ABSL49_1 TaxID=2920941 RepID=UPI001F0D9A3A|nr:hypothetical protein [Gordonia sp. ABSL49_1]MCH5645139.1 hypothetical protein [Gordonia sp. ABSL49_1]
MSTTYEARLDYRLPGGPFDLCGCHFCANEWLRAMDAIDPDGWRSRINSYAMILCRQCGCKRCPKASYHGHDCTASNESGQHGSVYGDFEIDESWRDDDGDDE